MAGHVQQKEGDRMDTARSDTLLELTCHPAREGHTFVFEYSLLNPGKQDVYVHDAMPSVDRETRAASANPRAVSAIHLPSGDAVIGKFIPPMPSSVRLAMPVTPLAHRLAAGETMERRLEAPEPLAETSPYLPDLLLRQYEVVDIAAVVFAISYWVSDTDGFVVTPTPYAEGMFSVVPTGGGPGAGARMVSQRFATRGLQLFRRTDGFPRTLAA
jgi:hypothetical protein